MNFWFWGKKGSRIFLGAIQVPKKVTNFQKLLKKQHTGELHKKIQFALGAAITRFFTHPVYAYIMSIIYIYIYNVEISVCMFDWLFITHKPLDWDEYPGERCVMKLVRTFIRRKEGKKRIGSGKNEEWWVVRKRWILCPNSFKSKEVNSGTNTTHFSVSKY